MGARLVAVGLLAAVAVTLAACSTGSSSANGGSGAPSSASSTTEPAPTTTTSPPSTTTPSSAAALSAPLATAATTEGNALATYQAVVAKLGAITPFANIVTSEQQHLRVLQTVAGHYGLTVPSGPFSASSVPATKTAACQLGVTTEKHLASTYDQLIGQVTAHPDVTKVFSTLQHSAADDHLPAFQHCA